MALTEQSVDGKVIPQQKKSRYLAIKVPFVVHVLGPLFFMLVSPSILLLLWYTNSQFEGSLKQLFLHFWKHGFLNVLVDVWKEKWCGSQLAWTIIAIFASLELLLMKIVPGKIVEGSVTPEGYIPKYKDNGLLCFMITVILYLLSVYHFLLFSPMLIYYEFGNILGALNVLSFSFCTLLYIKGIWFSTAVKSDHSGSPLFDFYWGTELHPRILCWDVKQFTNCRFGMMSWAILNLCFVHAQWHQFGDISDSMLISVSLQFIYITKFYLWESGYLKSLDIMHDKAGFYICWGCMVWIPGFYTLVSQYLVNHLIFPGISVSLTIMAAGSMFIFLNYDVDRQRKIARDTGGDCIIYGKQAEYIEAYYKDSQGESYQTILLTSGWWGCSRHFHYIPEVLAAFCWSVPAHFNHVLPYFYVIFLTLLLLERAFRDDVRCRQKYGLYWAQYCDKVKYLIVPGVL